MMVAAIPMRTQKPPMNYVALLGDPQREAEAEALVQTRYHIPLISPESPGRAKTITLGMDLRKSLKKQNYNVATDVGLDYLLHDVAIGPEGYQRTKTIVYETIVAFTEHRQKECAPNMALANLPRATHPLLVGRRAKHLQLLPPYNELMRAFLLLHDNDEDTTVSATDVCNTLYEKGLFKNDKEFEFFYDMVTSCVSLVTRRELVYVLDSLRFLDDATTPYTILHMSAAGKNEDRHVNNRSLEPWAKDPMKIVTELMKSIWIAEIAGKGLLERTDTAKLEGDELLFRSALLTATYDNLAALYGATTWLLAETEKGLTKWWQPKRKSEQRAKDIRSAVYSHIREGGLEQLHEMPTGDPDPTDSAAVEGTINGATRLLYPSKTKLKKRQDRDGTPIDALITDLVRRTPPYILSEQQHQQGELAAYAAIMEEQQRFREHLTEIDGYPYLVLFTMHKVAQRHLLDAGYRVLHKRGERR